MSSEFDDDDWQPPTEAEQKVLQARRERSDKISKLMGDYLLKGYKMLGVCCPVCDTILLQDKFGSNYCVACRELDADNVKDDPALSDEAALRQAAEQSQRISSSNDEDSSIAGPSNGIGKMPIASNLPPLLGASSSISGGTPALAQARADLYGLAADDISVIDRQTSSSFSRQESVRVNAEHPVQESCVRPKNHLSTSGISNNQSAVSEALEVLFGKLRNASVELQQSADVRHCTDLCVMVKSCAEAISALQKI